MDDFYTLDLLKLERFHCLKDCPTDALEWNESDESDDDSDDDDSDGSSSEHDEPAEQEGEEMREADLLEELEWLGDEGMSDEAIAAAKQALLEKEELRKKAKVFMGVALDSTRSEADMLSTPLPGAWRECRRSPGRALTLRRRRDAACLLRALQGLLGRRGARAGRPVEPRQGAAPRRLCCESRHLKHLNAFADLSARQMAEKRYDEYKPMLQEVRHDWLR